MNIFSEETNEYESHFPAFASTELVSASTSPIEDRVSSMIFVFTDLLAAPFLDLLFLFFLVALVWFGAVAGTDGACIFFSSSFFGGIVQSFRLPDSKKFL